MKNLTLSFLIHAVSALMLFGCNLVTTVKTSSRGATSGSSSLDVVIDPAYGKLEGGDRITISGLGITAMPSIVIGGLLCREVEFDSSDSISCVTPASSAGKKDLEVKIGETRYFIVREGFEYLAPLALTSSTPASGRAVGGARLTLAGQGFAPAAIVLIGSDNCSDTTVVDSTKITCTAPGKESAGKFPVIVRNTNGDEHVLDDGYTVSPLPSVASASPSSGRIAGGTRS